MPYQTMVQAAASFSARAHHGQVRKDGATPYAAHPARVAMICANVFGCTDDATLAAAFLHDVIEDCACDYDAVEKRFGEEVATYVAALTKDMRLPEPERERAYVAQIRAAAPAVRLIKLADTWDNLCDSDETRFGSSLDKLRHALKLAEADDALVEACQTLRTLLADHQIDLD
ncbi:MAG: HD domain-containing protein [Planctomycetota bacterium]